MHVDGNRPKVNRQWIVTVFCGVYLVLFCLIHTVLAASD
jgi:hypothetical protein